MLNSGASKKEQAEWFFLELKKMTKLRSLQWEILANGIIRCAIWAPFGVTEYCCPITALHPDEAQSQYDYSETAQLLNIKGIRDYILFASDYHVKELSESLASVRQKLLKTLGLKEKL